MNIINKKTIYVYNILLSSLVILYLVYLYLPLHYILSFKVVGMEIHRIAHAGGAINSNTYTNSYDALDYNLKNGFKYFELDFLFTSDGQLVCAHDWKKSFSSNVHKSISKPISLLEFEKLVSNNGSFKNCTLSGLSEWMKLNESAIIITDVKEGDNIKALEIIHNTLPNPNKRVIPQIYDPSEFENVKKMGFSSIIWTLYRYEHSDNSIIINLNKFEGKMAITMPKERSRSGLPKKLRHLGIPTYSHTINSESERLELIKNFSVTEIYTDYLFPEK